MQPSFKNIFEKILQTLNSIQYISISSVVDFDLTGSGGEDEQEDSRAGETERRAQTDGAGAVLSVTVCLSDQQLAVDAQMTIHYTTQTALQEQERFTGKYITAQICSHKNYGKWMV